MTANWRRKALESLAFLLMPDGARHRGLFVEADDRWSLGRSVELGDADVVIWGRAWAPTDTPKVEAIAGTVARERAFLKLRASLPHPYRLAGIHRLMPPSQGLRRPRSKARGILLSGGLAELTRSTKVHRALDRAAQDAGLTTRIRGFHHGSGGSALVRARGREGQDAFFRAARAGSAADPAHAARALERLAAAGVDPVPRALGRGLTAGVSWTTETALAGNVPKRAGAGLVREMVQFCARLPRSRGAVTAWVDDVELISSSFPRWAALLEQISSTCGDRLGELPGVLRHGDLWVRNVLVHEGHLSGVLDWDSWHHEGVPGTDLLYLVVTEQWRKGRGSLGELWLRRPWSWESFTALAGDYWKALGLRPDARTLDAIGIAGWASQVASNVSRAPQLSGNERWVSNNVDRVMAGWEGSSSATPRSPELEGGP